MASNIPTRRVTRATRPTQKEDENVNARPSRLATRSKPPSAAATTAGGSTRPTAGDAAVGKRKREALGEVTGKVTNNKAKPADAKGKGKEEAPAKPAARAPLRPVGTRTRSATVSEVKKEEDAMAVDLPHPPVPIVLVPAPPATRKAAARSSTTTTTTAVFRRPSIQKKPSLRAKEEPAEEEPELKRRRTSSEAPDEPLETLDRESNDIAAVDAGLAADNDEGWDDLDREDDDDPLMVSEYVVEIFNYLKEVELKTMPNPNYIENQKELAWKMRGILMDWLIQVHTRFRLLPETLFLCVNIIDRFLSARVVSLAKLQLVGVTCMFIAAKVEETVSPTVSNFIYCADSSYTEAEILQAEKYVLKTIDWNLSFPSPLNFLRRISKADEFNPQVRTIGKYLLEISCLEWRLLPAPPSLMAAASMWLAKLILDQPEWTPNLRHYSSYPEHALIPTANIMINYLLKPVSHESFFKKYASKRFMKASLFVREWVLDRWEERAQVDLMEEVPRLKAAALARQPIAAQEY